MTYRIVIKNLKDDTQMVEVGKEDSRRDATALLDRFRKLSWTLRRPDTFTIGDVVLTLEIIPRRTS